MGENISNSVGNATFNILLQFQTDIDDIKREQKHWIHGIGYFTDKEIVTKITTATVEVLKYNIKFDRYVSKILNKKKPKLYFFRHGTGTYTTFKTYLKILSALYEMSGEPVLKTKLEQSLKQGKNYYDNDLQSYQLDAIEHRVKEMFYPNWQEMALLWIKSIKQSPFLTDAFQDSLIGCTKEYGFTLEDHKITYEKLEKGLEAEEASTLYIRHQVFLYLKKFFTSEIFTVFRKRELSQDIFNSLIYLYRLNTNFEKLFNKQGVKLFGNNIDEILESLKKPDKKLNKVYIEFFETIRMLVIQQNVFDHTDYNGVQQPLSHLDELFIPSFFRENQELLHQMKLLFMQPNLPWFSNLSMIDFPNKNPKPATKTNSQKRINVEYNKIYVPRINNNTEHEYLQQAANATLGYIASNPAVKEYLCFKLILDILNALLKNTNVYHGLLKMESPILKKFLEYRKVIAQKKEKEEVFRGLDIEWHEPRRQTTSDIDCLSQAIDYQKVFISNIENIQEEIGAALKEGEEENFFRIRKNAYEMMMILRKLIIGNLIGVDLCRWHIKNIQSSPVFQKMCNKFPELPILSDLWDNLSPTRTWGTESDPLPMGKFDFLEQMLNGNWKLISAGVSGHKALPPIKNLPLDLIEYALKEQPLNRELIQKAFCWLKIYLTLKTSCPNTEKQSQLLIESLKKFKENASDTLDRMQIEFLKECIQTLESKENKSFSLLNTISLHENQSTPQIEKTLLETLSSEELFKALQVCILDGFLRIPVSEFDEQYGGKCFPQLNESIKVMDLLNNYIHFVILNKKTPSERKKIINKLIVAACLAEENGNFYLVQCIVGPLNCIAVSRLKTTWNLVNKVWKGKFEDLNELTSPMVNFKKYREVTKKLNVYVPFIPYVKKNFEFYNGANLDTKDSISVFTLKGVEREKQQFLQLQRAVSIRNNISSKYAAPFLKEITEISTISDDAFYDMSTALEPIKSHKKTDSKQGD